MNSRPFAIALFFLMASACDKPEKAASRPWFWQVEAKSGITTTIVSGDARRWYIPESNGSGAAWLDFDGDGDLDLFIGNGSHVKYPPKPGPVEVVRDTTSQFYRNDFPWKFVNITKEAGLATSAWVNGVATGDVDNDGDPDLYLACYGPDEFYLNRGGKFTNETASSGLGNARWAAAAAFGDPDNDGDLDLYVSNYCEFDFNNPPKGGARNVINGVEVGFGPEKENPGINVGAPDVFFINDGHGHFREAAAECGLELKKPLCSYAVIFSDVDVDGRQEILVANDGQPCNLFYNLGNCKFREEGEIRGFAFGEGGKVTSAMGLASEDVDGDGDFDVFRTNFDMEPNSLHINDGKGYFTDRAAEWKLAAPSVNRLGWDCVFYDSDCDGTLEIAVANGHVFPQGPRIGMGEWLQDVQFYELDRGELSKGKFTYTDVTRTANPYTMPPKLAGRGIAMGDVDNDGMMDLLVTAIDSVPALLQNCRERTGAWATVRLIGSKSTRDGMGAKVVVHAGGRARAREMRTTSGLYSSHDPRLHFGLGKVQIIDKIEVFWPSGVHQVLEKVAPNQFITIREGDTAAATK